MFIINCGTMKSKVSIPNVNFAFWPIRDVPAVGVRVSEYEKCDKTVTKFVKK